VAYSTITAAPHEYFYHTGSGKYTGATGTITLEGQAHNLFGDPGVGTFNEIYQGSVCGPDLKADGN
jgi:hypothetical protein